MLWTRRRRCWFVDKTRMVLIIVKLPVLVRAGAMLAAAAEPAIRIPMPNPKFKSRFWRMALGLHNLHEFCQIWARP